jgi:hypothetical protein
MEMHGKTSLRRHGIMTLRVICTDLSNENPRLSDVMDLERFPAHLALL